MSRSGFSMDRGVTMFPLHGWLNLPSMFVSTQFMSIERPWPRSFEMWPNGNEYR